MPRLEVDFVANLASLQKDMEKAVGLVDKGFRDMRRAGDTVKNLLGAIGVGLSAGAFAAFVKSQIDAADALNDLSKRLNVTVEELAGYKFVASQTGTSVEALATGFRKLQISLVDANTNRELAETFRILGVTAKEPTQAMLQLADGFKALGDRPERVAAAFRVLGKSGTELIPALAGGSEELQKMLDRGKQLSGVTTEAARQADEFNDQLAELKTVAGGLALEFGTRLIPALTEVAKAMQRIMTGGALFEHDQRPIIQKQIDSLMAFYQEALARGQQGVADGYRQQIDFLVRQLQQVNEQAKAEIPGSTTSEPDEGAASGEDKAKRLQLVAEYDELSKKLVAIQAKQQDEQTKLATKYVEDYQTLARARAAGVIATDRELGIQRLALAAQYEQDIAELEAKQAGNNRLAEKLAEERAARQQALADRVGIIQEGLILEGDAEEAAYQRKLLILTEANNTIIAATEEANAQKLLSDEEYHQQVELLELQHQARKGNIIAQAELRALALKKQTAKAQTNAVLGELVTMTAGVARYSKTLFQINKTAALAQTLLNLPEAVSSSFAFGARIGGPVLGAAMAAVAFAAQIAQVQAIKETTFEGAGSEAGVPSLAGTPGVPVTDVGPGLAPGAVAPVGSAAEPITVVVNLDGQPILETVQRASSDGRLVINAHSVR